MSEDRRLSRSRFYLWAAALLLAASSLAANAANVAREGVGVLDGKLLRFAAGETQAGEIPLPVRPARVFAATPEGVLFAAEASEMLPAGDARLGAELWQADLDGSHARRLLAGEPVLRAAWSAPARLLAVVTSDLAIRLVKADGAELRTLSAHGQSPAFSPDGRKLAYAAVPAGWAPGAQPGGFDLHVLDLQSGRDRRLTSGYDDAEPIWTPDGRALLFLSGGRTGLTSLWRIRADGKGLRQLTNAGQRALDERTFVPNPSANDEVAWSQDGRHLLYGARYTETGEVIVLAFERDGSVREMRDLGAGRSPIWNGEGVLALRPKVSGFAPVELSLEGNGVRKVVAVTALPRAQASDLPAFGERVQRGEEALALDGRPKFLAALFRWPATYYPAPLPTAYFVDLDPRAGLLNTNWCDQRTYDGHLGSDLQLACGSTVVAARGGVVDWRNDGCPNMGAIGSACGGGFGNFIELNHGNGWFSIYAHMRAGTPAPLGAAGPCGGVVGISATSGNSSGCHMHFEVRTYSGGTFWVWDPYNGACTNAGLWCTFANTERPGGGCC